MRSITRKTNSWTSRDQYNSTLGKSLQEAAGSTVEVKAMALGDDIDRETGEPKKTCYIVAKDGTAYSAISSTAYEQVSALIDMMDDGEDITLRVTMRPNKTGKREYIALELC